MIEEIRTGLDIEIDESRKVMYDDRSVLDDDSTDEKDTKHS